MPNDAVLEILADAKRLALRYRTLTGKPLGITGEVAEYESARILGVTLTAARQAGYDATEIRDGEAFRLQIKGRCVLEDSKRGQRMGSIDIKKEFDAVLLVLLDRNFEATAIYEASREAVITELTLPGSKARNERGSLGISKFKSIAHIRWQRASDHVRQSVGLIETPRRPVVLDAGKSGESMSHKSKVHELFGLMSDEVLAFIKESESSYSEGWVPATYIKNELKLNKSSYPQGNKIDNKTGWLFATIARHLQDENRVCFRKTGSRSFYKCLR